MFRNPTRLLSIMTALLATAAGLQPAAGQLVDLAYEPDMQLTAVGLMVDIDITAIANGNPSEEMGAIDAIVTWDPDFLDLIELDGANAGYAWFVSDFLNDPDGINDDLGDGSALYTALAQTNLPAEATAGGLVVSTLRFQALAPTASTTVSFTPAQGSFGMTRVLAFSTPNSPITGNISSTAEVEIVAAIPCTTIADCGDMDDDGFRDDACRWYACVSGFCLSMFKDAGQADIGGFNGACPIDGTCDANDRFHALNCFSNRDTTAVPGIPYPCEDNPPTAVNVDAGGPNGSCDLDGVCDGNDAFHALNCFENMNTSGFPPYLCGCSNPAPMPPVRLVGYVDISLAAPRTLQRGRAFEVDVFLESAVQDLRGYQLHVGTSGGQRGALELVDIAVHERPDHVFAGLNHFDAYNVHTQQVVVGLVEPGIETKPGTYLATFAYRPTSDALGTFSIDVLHGDPVADRTFLFATPSRDKFVVQSTGGAQVEIAGKRDSRRPR